MSIIYLAQGKIQVEYSAKLYQSSVSPEFILACPYLVLASADANSSSIVLSIQELCDLIDLVFNLLFYFLHSFQQLKLLIASFQIKCFCS